MTYSKISNTLTDYTSKLDFFYWSLSCISTFRKGWHWISVKTLMENQQCHQSYCVVSHFCSIPWAKIFSKTSPVFRFQIIHHVWQMQQLRETPFQLLITSLKVFRLSKVLKWYINEFRSLGSKLLKLFEPQVSWRTLRILDTVFQITQGSVNLSKLKNLFHKACVVIVQCLVYYNTKASLCFSFNSHQNGFVQ